ncbi:MAG: hypothetical protein IPK83_24930 [Planctomycetes bacterium]|nr:hypothetical protein [Planctomycetota bacterium]
MNTALNTLPTRKRAQLYETVAGLMRLAYEQQGIKALESRDASPPCMRAGHAVVFRRRRTELDGGVLIG